MPAICVSIKTDVYIGLEKAAAETGLKKSTITEMALKQYLAEMEEDREDAVIAKKAWTDFEKSGKKTIPAEEVYRELGL